MYINQITSDSFVDASCSSCWLSATQRSCRGLLAVGTAGERLSLPWLPSISMRVCETLLLLPR